MSVIRKRDIFFDLCSRVLGGQHSALVERQSTTKIQFSILFVSFALDQTSLAWGVVLVNDGDYLNAVSEQSLAENVTRVLYPNDNVRFSVVHSPSSSDSLLVHARQRTSFETRIFSRRGDTFGHYSSLQTFEIWFRFNDS